MLTIKPVLAFEDNYIWLISVPGKGHAAVVDPGDALPVLEYLDSNGLALEAVIVTHDHGDHVGGILELCEQHDARVYGPEDERIPRITHPVRGGDRVELPGLGLEFSVIHTPGHTFGSVCYLGGGALFSGDTLFTCGCGRLFGGSPGQMYGSLSTLAVLEETTRIYCAHEYTLSNLRFAFEVEPNNRDLVERRSKAVSLQDNIRPTVPSVLDLEKRTNPFFRCEVPEVRAAGERWANKPLSTPVSVFAALRSWKDSF